MIHWLWEPFQYGFVRLGFVAALLASIACASLGVYVILRRMAFIGDAISHAALPGLAIAFVLKINLAVGALAAALLTALGISIFTRRQEVHEDSAIGIMFTGMFALGIVLMNLQNNYRDLTHMLFGNLLGVSSSDAILMGVVAVLVVFCLYLFSKELFLTTCDPSYAFSIGLRPERIQALLLILLALAIVAGILVLGVVLTSALLITPAATARLITNHWRSMMLLAVGTAMVSCLIGIYASYYAGLSSGASIVLSSTLLFMLTWILKTARIQVNYRKKV